MTDEVFKNFITNCTTCSGKGEKNETHLHIDWEKKYYMVLCFNCKTTEAFNSKGKRLELKPEEDEKNLPN